MQDALGCGVLLVEHASHERADDRDLDALVVVLGVFEEFESHDHLRDDLAGDLAAIALGALDSVDRPGMASAGLAELLRAGDALPDTCLRPDDVEAETFEVGNASHVRDVVHSLGAFGCHGILPWRELTDNGYYHSAYNPILAIFNS